MMKMMIMTIGEMMGLNEKYIEDIEFAKMLDKKLSSKRKLATLIFPINLLLMVILSVLGTILNVHVLISIIVVVIILPASAAFFYYATCQKIHIYECSLFTTLSKLTLQVLTDNPVSNDAIMIISKIAVLSKKHYNDYNFFEGD